MKFHAHMDRVHAGHAILEEESATSSQSTSQVTTQSTQGEGRKRCELCSKTYLNDVNLKKHMQKIHVEPRISGESITNEVWRTRSASQRCKNLS